MAEAMIQVLASVVPAVADIELRYQFCSRIVMTSLAAQWIPQPTGPPLIEWLCGYCGDVRLFEVNNVDARYSGLGVRLMTCTHCGAPDMLSMVAGRAAARVRAVPGGVADGAFPLARHSR